MPSPARTRDRLFEASRSSKSLLAWMLPLTFLLFAAAAVRGGDDFAPLSFDNFAVGGQSVSQVTVSSHFLMDPDGVRGVLQIRADIEPGFHIYSVTQPKGGTTPTKIIVDRSPKFELTGDFRPDKAPTEKRVEYYSVPLEEQTGTVTWSAPFRVTPDTDVQNLEISGHLEGQVCDENNCLPFDDLAFTAAFAGNHEGLFVDPPADETADAVAFDISGLVRNIGFGILGGMLLNLMPCVLPVIGLKIMSFVEQSHGSRARAFQLNVVYSLGILTVFLALATLAAGANLSWGEQFTHLPFKITMIALVFAMALSFLGVWEIPIPGFVGAGKSAQLAAREGVAGAFFKGVFATILATPCSGPFLGPVFGYTISQPPFVTYVIMMSVGIGMALPYLVIGMFPQLARWIPKPGAWMETFKELMGFVLLGTVVFLFTTLGNPDYFVPTLALLVGIWFACWVIGRTPFTEPLLRRALSWMLGIAITVLVGYFSMTWLVPGDKHIDWQPYSKSSLAEAQDQGKTVLVDFTAQWCLTCKVNLVTAIDTKEVGDLVEQLGILPMIADWTNRSPEIKSALAELGSDSIPLLAIYPADKPNEPIILRDTVSQRQVLEALEAAGPSAGVQLSRRSSALSAERGRY